MLKKLLKYDFNSIFKYWWIGALTTFILSFVGTGCISINCSPKDFPEPVYVFSTIGIVLVVLSFSAFALMTALLVYIRFYKHFYSDEGYLTFTLPVKRYQLLTSKLISGSVATLLTALVTLINGAIVLIPVLKEDVFYKGWEKDFKIAVSNLVKANGIFNLTVDGISIILIVLLSVVLVTLFAYLCITVGCIVSKKAKIASAIGIYYGLSTVATVLMYLFYFFAVDTLDGWMSKLPNEQELALIPVILILVILIMLMLCLVFYTLINWLMDRKLNLT